MKMKYHKIRGVPLDVCTAEAMVAYNTAFRASTNYGDRYAVEKEKSAMCATDLIHGIIFSEMKNITGSEKYSRYNPDAIKSCLLYGLKTYMDGPFIATDYAEIGRVFRSCYL